MAWQEDIPGDQPASCGDPMSVGSLQVQGGETSFRCSTRPFRGYFSLPQSLGFCLRLDNSPLAKPGTQSLVATTQVGGRDVTQHRGP